MGQALESGRFSDQSGLRVRPSGIFCRICPRNRRSSIVSVEGVEVAGDRSRRRCPWSAQANGSGFMLSDQAIKQAILGKDIEQKVTDCLQDWAGACSDAVKEMMEKQRLQQDAEAAKAQFVISLIGNLAWAATVFFPPAAAVAVTKDFFGPGGYSGLTKIMESPGPSGVTKIVSVLGAAVGSGTINQLISPTGSLDWTAIGHHLGELVPKIGDKLATVANEWKDSYLINHMIATFSLRTKPNINRSNDEDFKDWCNGYEGGRELRKAAWEKFVFPVDGLSFALGQEGLKNFLLGKLTNLKTRYDTQLKRHEIWMFQRYMGYVNSFPNPLSMMTFEEWRKRRGQPFHFVADIDGLPPEFLKAQDSRLRETEFRIAAHSLPTDEGEERIPVPGAGLRAR